MIIPQLWKTETCNRVRYNFVGPGQSILVLVTLKNKIQNPINSPLVWASKVPWIRFEARLGRMYKSFKRGFPLLGFTIKVSCFMIPWNI